MLGWLIGFIIVITLIIIADISIIFRDEKEEKKDEKDENDVIVNIEEMMKKK
jgi:beta-lactamase regulating signal transducer with metallopeptidase domain